MHEAFRPPSGHVFRLERKRGPAWYAKYRLPDGRQVQKKLGPAWTDRGRPPAGYFTKRTAEAWLRDVLDQARRGTLPGMNLTGRNYAAYERQVYRPYCCAVDRTENSSLHEPSSNHGRRRMVGPLSQGQ